MKCINLIKAAERLDVSETTVRRYVKAGKIPAFQLDRIYRIVESDLEKFIEDRMVVEGGNRK